MLLGGAYPSAEKFSETDLAARTLLYRTIETMYVRYSDRLPLRGEGGALLSNIFVCLVEDTRLDPFITNEEKEHVKPKDF